MKNRSLKRTALTAMTAIVSLSILAANSQAQTVTVTTLNDVSDFSGSQQVGNLPGPDGRVSFREAVTAANNTPGAQTIAFAIPTSEFWLFPDIALLRLEQDAFFLIDSATTIDFTTQTTNIGNTNPNGPEVGIYGLQPNGYGVAAIFINGNNCVLKGLGPVYQRGFAARIVGHNNRVIGCQIKGPLHSAILIGGYVGSPPPTGNIIGGTTPGEGNTLAGLRIDGPAEGNIAIGNAVIGVGVEVRGATQFGAVARNNRIGGTTPAERNVIAGAGRFGEEGFPVGAQVSVLDADGTIVVGNYIGTTADGMQPYAPQYGPTGVEVRDARGTAIRNNLIAGLRVVGRNHYQGQVFGQAIHVNAVNANTSDTLIEGNTIGVGADGITPVVTRSGIQVAPLSSARHALGTLIASNHIAWVETTGIVVASPENGITVTRNSIHDCGALGIDLLSGFTGNGGVTPNDAGDGDEGGNGLQNFPVLLSATTTGATIEIAGTLNSLPSETFVIEFFSSPSGDPSGFGEGAEFLGSTSVTTNSAGHASFSVTLAANVSIGEVATATATRVSTGDTSEFSAWISVRSGGALVSPTGFAVVNGFHFGGSLSSLMNSDNNRLIVLCDSDDSIGEIHFFSNLPAGSLNELKFKLEGRATRTDLSQLVDMYNFATQSFVNVHFQTTTLFDSVVEGSISQGAANFVDATRAVKSRVLWIPNQDLISGDGWTQSVDQVVWTMIP